MLPIDRVDVFHYTFIVKTIFQNRFITISEGIVTELITT